MNYYILLFIFLFSPVAIILLTEKSKLASRVGSIIIAYGFGVLLGNIGLFPTPGSFLSNYLSLHPDLSLADVEFLFSKGIIAAQDVTAYKIYKMQDILMSVSIPLAIPLLLFSLNIRQWFRMAGPTFLSMVLALISIVFVIGICTFLFRNHIPGIDKIAGMLIGLYSGGTPNLAALKMMLNVDADTYIRVHTYDLVPSLLYLLFLVSIGPAFFRRILLPYPKPDKVSGNESVRNNGNGYRGFFRRDILLPLFFSLLVAVVIFAFSGMLSLFVVKHRQMLVVLLSITTLGIIASTFRRINRIEKTFELGMYFILLFSIVVASLADVQRLIDISAGLFLMISIAIFGTLLLHTVLCKIFRIDADTLMVTSTALICSPPFVPMIAGALKNREVLVGGLTVGIIGYALGNYLGVLVSVAVKFFLY